MKKNLFVPCVALSILASACSIDSFDSVTDTENCEVKLQISNWDGSGYSDGTITRAGEPLTPVTILLVKDQTVIDKTTADEESFSINVPNGDYDIYAICGLPEDIIPDDITTPIAIPESREGNGLRDFAMGTEAIVNNHGKLSPSTLSIVAKRQMAWLTVTISDIPTYFTEFTLYVKGMGETYNIVDGWSASDEALEGFKPFIMARKPGKNVAVTDRVCIPSIASKNSTEFRIIAKTSDSKTLTYSYTSSTPLTYGKHLTLNLSISELALLSDTLTQDDWDNSEESGTLSDPTITTEN